ncbi:hypothetical protein [Deinococcus sp. AJ005]|uniref:hypothetical protein n=1 Tax=Deinococcus sp. AJ005 TaxID=2652443 RepID=UPI00125CCC4A|nr:hypothetical protein [Deinococcus sp. AJ005]QFP75288.1 hypothetical protein DAAJ005_01700 [Deinococcus sp. AJ005]
MRAALLLTYLTVEGETTVASAATALLAEGCTRTEERRRHASIRELARWTGEYVHHPALITVHTGQLRLSGAFEWSSDLADALTQGRLTAADLPRVDCVWIHDLSERSLGHF